MTALDERNRRTRTPPSFRNQGSVARKRVANVVCSENFLWLVAGRAALVRLSSQLDARVPGEGPTAPLCCQSGSPCPRSVPWASATRAYERARVGHSLALGKLFRCSRLGRPGARRQAPKSCPPLGAPVEPCHIAIAALDSDPLSSLSSPLSRQNRSICAPQRPSEII